LGESICKTSLSRACLGSLSFSFVPLSPFLQYLNFFYKKVKNCNIKLQFVCTLISTKQPTLIHAELRTSEIWRLFIISCFLSRSAVPPGDGIFYRCRGSSPTDKEAYLRICPVRLYFLQRLGFTSLHFMFLPIVTQAALTAVYINITR
jgi:hypothetical protein